MEQYNKQASEYIFRENNAEGRVPANTIDLHGQFVEEAEDILEERIKYARSTGQTHLHVIVGKGNHSPGHVQKIRPRVEQVCRELGLQYHTEPNEGRIYVNLTGGAVEMDHVNNWQGYQQQQYQQQQSGGYQQNSGYPSQGQHNFGQQQQQQHGGQQNNQNAEIEKLARKFLPRILRQLKKLLCT
jgi:Smr domain